MTVNQKILIMSCIFLCLELGKKIVIKILLEKSNISRDELIELAGPSKSWIINIISFIEYFITLKIIHAVLC